METSSAMLLNNSAARVEALRLIVKVMITTLARTGALPGEQFAAHLKREADKMTLLDSPDNEYLAQAQAARDHEMGACIALALEAASAPPLAMRPPPGTAL